jgi:HK97 family phage portal protein
MSIPSRIASAVKAVFSIGDATARAWSWVSSSWGGWGSLSYERLVKLASANPYTSRGLRLIAQTIATVPLAVYKADGKEAPGHWLTALLARPRPGWTWRRMTEAIVWALYCGGRVYVERVVLETGPKRGQASRLRLWAPNKLQSVERDAAGDVTAYNFGGFGGRTHTVPAEDVLDVRCTDPLDFDGGAMPILVGARRALVAIEGSDEWNASVSRGKGHVSGLLMPKNLPAGKTMSPEQVADAQKATDAAFGSREPGGPPLVTNGFFEYQANSVTPRAAEALGIRQMSAREVSAVLGVSATLLGDEKTGSLTDAGMNSEVRALLVLTALPFLDMVLDELTTFLLVGSERLAYDVDQIDALGEDVNAKWKRYGDAVGVVVNSTEAREALGYSGALADDGAGPPSRAGNAGGDGATRSLPPTWRPSTSKSLGDRVAEIIANGDGRGRED